MPDQTASVNLVPKSIEIEPYLWEWLKERANRLGMTTGEQVRDLIDRAIAGKVKPVGKTKKFGRMVWLRPDQIQRLAKISESLGVPATTFIRQIVEEEFRRVGSSNPK